MNTNTKTGYPSIDKPWLKYYTEKDLKNVAGKTTVFENIYQNNSKYPDDIALIYYDNKITYKVLFEKVEIAKQAFLKAGVKEGDNVAFLMLSCPEMIYAILALNKIGACANMINPTFTAEQMRDRINDSEADIILILDQLYERILSVIENTCPKTRVIVPLENSMPTMVKAIAHFKLKKNIEKKPNIIYWNEFYKTGSGENLTSDYTYKENMPAVMVYSSGTTGASKGIVLTNDGINGTIAHYDKEDFVISRSDTFFHLGASWFSTFMVVCLLMPLQKGIAVIIEPVFSEETFFKGLKKYNPTMTLGPTSLWLHVINHPDRDKVDLSNMKYPITGGEKLLPETECAVQDYLKKQGCTSRMIVGYGMCELGSTAVTTSTTVFKTGSVGYPITGVTVSAFNMETNSEMKYGERGEIRVLTPNRMKGYYKRPDATSEFFWEDEKNQIWCCTGDVGCVDEDGFVYIEGRATDSFISKTGNRIYNFDVENVVLENNHIYQCESVGVKNADGYENPFVFVVLNSGDSTSNEEIKKEIKDLCSEKLDADSQPVGVEIIDKFPIKPSGKRDMETLMKMAEKAVKGVN